MTHPARCVTLVGTAGAIGVLLVLHGVVGPVESYAPTTHAEFGAIAVDRSNLDAILKSQYGVDRGASFAVDGQAIRTWIAIGATREDFPPVRSLNHFHSPLKPWHDAGGPLGQSSVYWQHTQSQGLRRSCAWPVARQRVVRFLVMPHAAR